MVNDMTKGSPVKAMTLFAIPLFIGTLFQQVYNMVDTLVVGFIRYRSGTWKDKAILKSEYE